MQIKANFWIEKDGEVVLSRWRIALLRAIAQTGSISGAAEYLDIPYRRAWDKIRECEERLGLKLIETQTGGSGGGGTQLTPEGADFVRRFREFSEGLDELIKHRFQESFEGTDLE
jgi:molybdate transport system regulatory protein